MPRIPHLALLLLCVLFVSGLAHADDQKAPVDLLPKQNFTEQSLANLTLAQALNETISRNPQFTQFAQFIENLNLTSTLNDTSKNYTVFVPDFSALAEQIPKLFRIDNATLADIARYHIVPWLWRNDQLNNSVSFAQALLTNRTRVNLPEGEGQVVGLIKNESGFYVHYGSGTAKVQQADITLKNGVVHIVDKVFTIPQNTTETLREAKLSKLSSLLDQANLTEAVNNFTGITLFAPSDDALDDADLKDLNQTELVNLLKYHLLHPDVIYSNLVSGNTTIQTVQGSNLTAFNDTKGVQLRDAQNNTVRVISANQLTSNGVVHVIDKVLKPPNDTLNGTMPVNLGITDSRGARSAGSQLVATGGWIALISVVYMFLL
ncbi:uncharacterized protein VTP21DRAFT_6976 [Calcarisporiella thermophila]|uniref:uncharacterized protein n=1 Tax=Calcarisporiella thermophila TaxID=911321 RepID=UPI0037443039